MDAHVFRVMDPASRRMLGVRADMTPQIARIAATRLSPVARPLRLSYGGQVLNVQGTQMRPDRQLTQAGAELIGIDSVAADVEIIVISVEALAAVGIDKPTVDLNSPALVGAILDALEADNARLAELRTALNHKDAANVAQLATEATDILTALIMATGSTDDVLARLEALDLPPAAAAEVARLRAVADGAPRPARRCRSHPSIRSSIAASSIRPVSALPCSWAAYAANWDAADVI